MIWIDKQREPDSWTEHRLTSGAIYEPTTDLRNALLADQGYICAFCMRRIPADDSPFEHATSKIEHLLSQEHHSDLQMNYSNMVVCCSDRMNGEMHCDASKGEADIQCSPLSRAAMQTIKYKNDGTIESTNAVYNSELNDVLNLNVGILKDNRKAAWEAARDYFTNKDCWNVPTLRKMLERYQSKGKKGKKIEYCGIVIYMLTKKLRQQGIVL